VLEQTIDDWEVIIIDDGSTDNTWSVMLSFAKKDSRISIIRMAKNGGISKTRNEGIKLARGKYIAFLDSDDIWFPEKLAKQLEVFIKGEDSVGLVYTGVLFVNEEKNTKRAKYARVGGDILKEEIINNPIGGPSRVMIKRECVEKCGYFDEDFLTLEDWDMWIRICKNYEVGFVPEPMVYYTESNDSISLNVKKIIKGYESLWMKYHISDYPKKVLSTHFLRLGNRLLFNDAISLGKDYIRRAFIKQPISIKNISMIILSFLPIRIYKFIVYRFLKYAK
jgi:glycosyltransferase involved in cell wall biosynthesis